MTEGIKKGVQKEEYVEVLHNYSYQRDDRSVCMTKDEILMLLKRSNDDWWQVIRQGEKRPFFAPAQYLKVANIPPEQMKQTIKQGRHFQKVSGFQSSDENVPIGRPQGLALPLRESKSVLPGSDMHSPSIPLASHSYMTKIETNRIPIERTDPYPGRSTSTSSFKSESPLVPTRGLPPRNGNNELVSSAAYSRGFAQQVSQESSSSLSSRSSLNDGSRCSTESLTHLLAKKHVIKAASHDELSSGDHCRSSLDISQPRAASSEELDSRYSGRDYLFRSNQLSYRHRSNSVDFRIFQRDLTFSELKQGSLDKIRKPRITKDPSNRRRSWAVEEIRVPDNHRSFKKGDTQDVSLVLDVPPKLPPKLRKHRPTSSSSENIGKLEGPIDVKVQEVKSSKPPPPLMAPNVKRLSQDYDKGSSRQEADILDAPENPQWRGASGRQEGQDVPVALPRRILPPQLFPFDGKSDIKRSQSGGSIFMSQSMSVSEVITRDNNGNQVKSEKKETSSDIQSTEFGSFKERSFESDEGRRVMKSDSFGRVPGTPDLLRKMDRTPDSLRKVYGSHEIPRGRGYSDPSVKLSVKTSEEKGEEEKENEDRFPTRETPTPDSSRAGKFAYQFPPSPKISPQRIVFDDWGEYYDESTKRQFFYNTKTREKRWKPPRKGIHSVSIPEVPPFGRGDRYDFGGRGQPRSPPPDYPTSPKSAHRPRYNQFEGVLPSSSNKSSTLGNSSSRSPHHPEASSHTLPAFTSNSPNKSSSHPQLGQSVSLTTPPAPPSSAKPTHIPAAPTSPNAPDFPELSEAEQNSALLDVLYNLSPPKGWKKKYDAYTQRVYFYSRATRERWLPANTEDGKIYYYNDSGSKSQWKLPEHDECDDSADGKEPLNSPMSPNESLRISLVSANLNEFSRNTEKEGFLHRTFLMRDGKKCRKDWKQSYARYIIGQFNSGSSGLLYFSKNKDEDKKAEMFEFHESCLLEHSSDKKTSRQQVLGLRNGRDTEVLLQFDDKDIADEWFKVLIKHEGMHFDNSSVQEKSKKGSGKVRRESSNDNLNQDNQGITLKLLSFIKKRPLKETLEKKGIYKEAVFGSTLAELASQDKTVTPIFVLQCIKNIESTDENLRTDGLYRISGNAAHIQKIRYEIAQRNYAILSKEKDVHNLSGSLKLFFRELKEPLIPYANYDDFIQATGAEFRRVNQQIEKLSKAVRRLPAENFETLKVLLTHLLRVTEFESDNRMSVSNLAIVFGPCLLWPKDTTSNDLMTDVMLHNRIIEGLLSDFTKIFPSKR